MTEPLRVLQIITGLGAGGAERQLLDLTAGLEVRGHDVHLVTLKDELDALSAFGHEDREVNVFDLSRRNASQLIALHRFIRKLRPDVIHAHMFHALLASLVTTRFLPFAVPICFTGHRSRHAPLRRAAIRLTRSLRAGDVIFGKDSHPALNARTVEVIANGVPVHQDPPARPALKDGNGPRFVAVGRLTGVKDCFGLLDSFLTADISGARLDFIGDGDQHQELSELIAQAGLQDRVRILGFRPDARKLLARYDIFVMHSRQEGMPMALLEAGAEAMPVVSTPVGAVPDILAKDRGRLATAGQFAGALRELAGDPAKALAMGRALHAHVVRNLSIEASVRAHEHLYQRLRTRASSPEPGVSP